jgi:hypothetical protein
VASPLENLSGPGKSLQKEPADAKEFAGLKRSALARLTDSAKNSNSLESRFDLALQRRARALFGRAALARIPVDQSLYRFPSVAAHPRINWRSMLPQDAVA